MKGGEWGGGHHRDGAALLATLRHAAHHSPRQPPLPSHRFAALTGDTNPIHVDASFAASSPFRRPLAHGLLYAALIPAIFGSVIPGCVYVSQELHFRKPVWVGDAVRARVVVTGVREVPARRGDDAATPGGGGGRPAFTPRLRQQLVTCSTVVARATDAGGGAPTGEDGWELCLDGTASVLLPPPRQPPPPLR